MARQATRQARGLRDVACERCGVIARNVPRGWARLEAIKHEGVHGPGALQDGTGRCIVYVVKPDQILYHDEAGTRPCWPVKS